VLYLEAEAVGARSTGIGCFYDDAVHDTLGLAGHEWQSLYHFSMGMPVEDTRLTTEPGYRWEQAESIDVSPRFYSMNRRLGNSSQAGRCEAACALP
jgi:hypothetical protein